MRYRVLVAAGLTAGLVAAAAPAEEEGYRHGRVRFVDPGVSLQRATEVSAEEALANLPFLPGDRVWTDSAGRVEFQFPDGTVVRLDSRSKLDYAGHEEGEQERIVLRLWSGSAIVRVRTRSFARFELETPAGMVQALERGIVRVDVEAGETRVSVYAGEAALDDGHRQVRLAAGERTYARWGGEAEEPSRFDPGEDDDFARWDGMRESEDRWAAGSSEHLPDELDAYAGEFESNGSWRYEGTAGGDVWVPQVGVGWQPYSNGHWAWTPYGWTWVPYEPWGWAPFHYGRWGHSASFGWYWMPGRHWGPGWVSWAVGGGYVGWCPLGRYNHPVSPWGRYRGRAVAGGRYGGLDAWHVVRQPHLGLRDLRRHQVGIDQVDPAGLRVADSVRLRPTRDAHGLSEDRAVPRTISRRMTPGDFVRELGTDNKTTIPAPWTRGYGSPPPGADGARYGTPRRTDRTDQERPTRGWITNPGTGSAAERRRGSPTGSGSGSPTATDSGGGSGGAVTPRQTTRPAPGYTPRATDGDSDRGDRVRRREGSDGSRSGDRSVPGGTAYRPRPGAGSSGEREGGSGGSDKSRGYVPRGSTGGDSSGGDATSGSRPRGSGGSSGASRPRSSGGDSSGASRPRSSYRSVPTDQPRSSGDSSGSYRPRSGSGGGSVPAYRPPSSSGGGSSGAYRPRGSSGGGSVPAHRPPSSSGGGSSGAYRPRSSSGGGSVPAYRPPSSSGGGGSGGYQPRSSGGGSGGGPHARPSGGGSSRSSGGGSSGGGSGRSNSGGHARPRGSRD